MYVHCEPYLFAVRCNTAFRMAIGFQKVEKSVRRRRKLEIYQERVRVMMKVMERFGEYVVAGKLH